ncbi:nSTAND1 domain-containing NTPase [Nocardia gipuzkoensis]
MRGPSGFRGPVAAGNRYAHRRASWPERRVAGVSRIFLSHSSRDNVEAIALRQWLIQQRPELAGEVFLDIDPAAGIGGGVRWKEALRQANSRCEAVICLVSRHWQDSHECRTEYRTAETLGKQILVARLEPVEGDITREWQRCDLFGDGPTTTITVDPGGGRGPVRFQEAGLARLLAGLAPAGIGAEHFPWPPPSQPDRAPYRGWEPFEAVDAAVFFGRDTQILRGRDRLVAMRAAGVQSVFAILGPSGAGKSSYLRAGLLPRLARDDRHFTMMNVLRPAREALTGPTGLAVAIHATRALVGLREPSRGQISLALPDRPRQVRVWLQEIQQAAAARILDAPPDAAPTLILPIDQAEELFGPDASEQGQQLLGLLAELLATPDDGLPRLGLIVVACMRTDRYEAWQTAPQLAGIDTVVFDDLGPLPQAMFKDVITGPAARQTHAGTRLEVRPDLVDRLLADCTEGADTLPMLALTLSRLYQDYGDTGLLTLDHYTAIGGVGQAVRREIEHILGSDPAQRRQQLALLRSAFIPWLATVNPASDQPLRRIAAWNDLPPESHRLLDQFVDRRLLVKNHRDGNTTVEVALESLLRQWDELADWLREHAEDLKTADTIEHTARAWARNDHDDAWLLGGTRLLAAETLITKSGYHERLAPAGDFVTASRRHHDSRVDAELRATRNRARILTALVAVLVVVAVLAGIGFVNATRASNRANAQTRSAIAERLIQDGAATLQGRQTGSDIHAIQEILAAHALAPSSRTATALIDARYARRHLHHIIQTRTEILDVDFSPDGTRIVSGSRNGTSSVWDTVTGQPVGEPFTGHTNAVTSVDFSPDGTRIVSGSSDHSVRIRDAATGHPLGAPLTGHTDAVVSVDLSPDGTRIVSGSNDGTLRLWDTATGRPVGEPLTGHTRGVRSVAFSPDGTRIVSGGVDASLRLWDSATGQAVGESLVGDRPVGMTSVAFSPDGTRIVSGSPDGTLRLWDAATTSPIGEPLTATATAGLATPVLATSVVFNRAGTHIIATYNDNAVRIWDVATRRPSSVPLTGNAAAAWGVAVSPDDTRIASGSVDGTLRIWDATTIPITGHINPVTSVDISPDGTRIVSGSADNSLRLWDATTRQLLGEPLTGHTDALNDVAFSPDGTRIVSGSDDGSLRLWDTATGRPVGEPLTGHTGAVTSVDFSPDGTRILSGSNDRSLRIWDGANGQPVGEPLTGHTGSVGSVAFSPDGTRIVSGSSGGTIRLWDTATRRPLGEPLEGHIGSAWSVAFSPDGTRILSGSLDHTLRLWDTATGHPIGEPLTGHTAAVSSVAFSPDGTRIVSGSADSTLRLWDTATGHSLGAPLTGHYGWVNSVAFSPNGKYIASGGRDNTIQIWPVFAPSAADLCAKLPSNMSHKNWRHTVSTDIDYITLCPELPTSPDDN